MKKHLNNIIYILFLIFTLLYPLLPSYGAYNTDKLVYIMIAVLILLFLFEKTERKILFSNIKEILLNDKIFLTLILLNISMYFSSLVAINKYITITNSIRFSMYLFIFYLICYKFNKKQKNIILITLLISSIFVSIIGIYQLIKVEYLGDNLDISNRISSTLENPNNLGVYSIMLLFIFITFTIKFKDKKKYLFLCALSIILLFSNIIISQSRNALIALILGIIILIFILNKKYLIYTLIIPIILFILPQSRNRLIDIFNFSQNDSRIKIWELTKIMINNNNQIFGIGYENYSIEYPRYVESNLTYFVRESLHALHPHNALLKFQVELGILGSLLFLLFIFFIFYNFYKTQKNKLCKSNLIYIGLFTSLISFQIMNIIDCYYTPLKIMYTFIIILAIFNRFTLKDKNKDL